MAEECNKIQVIFYVCVSIFGLDFVCYFCLYRCEGRVANLTTCLWRSDLLAESNWNNFVGQVYILPFGKM